LFQSSTTVVKRIWIMKSLLLLWLWRTKNWVGSRSTTTSIRSWLGRSSDAHPSDILRTNLNSCWCNARHNNYHSTIHIFYSLCIEIQLDEVFTPEFIHKFFDKLNRVTFRFLKNSSISNKIHLEGNKVYFLETWGFLWSQLVS